MTLRKVIGYSSGASDTVLFSCGHTCVMEPGSRKSASYGAPSDAGSSRWYPRRRQCFRCPDEAPTGVKMTEKEFAWLRRGASPSGIHWIGWD